MNKATLKSHRRLEKWKAAWLLLITISITLLLACSNESEQNEDDASLFFLLTALAASRSNSTAPDPNFYYSNASTAIPNDAAMQNMNPSFVIGSFSSFSVVGTLPAGLTLSNSTGRISGTTTEGTNTTGLSFSVKGISTTGASYTTNLTLRVGSSANITCNTSGTAAGCSASFPSACNQSSFCYSSASYCRSSAYCSHHL